MSAPGLTTPRTVRVLALAGMALLVLPLVALAVAGGAERLGDALGSAAVRQALWLTAWTSALATLVAVVVGAPLAIVAERSGRAVSVAAGVIGEVTLVVPPVVLGLGLLLALGRDGLLGAALEAANLVPTFRSGAVVLAQASVAIPLVVLAVRAGLATSDPLPEQAAAVHGMGPLRRTLRVTLPMVRRSILLGAALAWGRAAGEFGATLTFAGSLPGRTRTLPLAVFVELQDDPGLAAAAALIQVGLAVGALAVARALQERAG